VTESVALPPDLLEHPVPQAYYHTDPSLLPIDRPRCPKCQGRMMLARIEPGPAHSDLRTFECPKCEHVQRMLVEDPMKSVKAGWQNSGLTPPK
jgi:ribosomal protein S27AE